MEPWMKEFSPDARDKRSARPVRLVGCSWGSVLLCVGAGGCVGFLRHYADGFRTALRGFGDVDVEDAVFVAGAG